MGGVAAIVTSGIGHNRLVVMLTYILTNGTSAVFPGMGNFCLGYYAAAGVSLLVGSGGHNPIHRTLMIIFILTFSELVLFLLAGASPSFLKGCLVVILAFCLTSSCHINDLNNLFALGGCGLCVCLIVLALQRCGAGVACPSIFHLTGPIVCFGFSELSRKGQSLGRHGFRNLCVPTVEGILDTTCVLLGGSGRSDRSAVFVSLLGFLAIHDPGHGVGENLPCCLNGDIFSRHSRGKVLPAIESITGLGWSLGLGHSCAKRKGTGRIDLITNLKGNGIFLCSLVVGSGVGSVTGDSYDLRRPACEGVGVLRVSGLVGAAGEGGSCAVLVGFRRFLAVHDPGDGVDKLGLASVTQLVAVGILAIDLGSRSCAFAVLANLPVLVVFKDILCAFEVMGISVNRYILSLGVLAVVRTSVGLDTRCGTSRIGSYHTFVPCVGFRINRDHMRILGIGLGAVFVLVVGIAAVAVPIGMVTGGNAGSCLCSLCGHAVADLCNGLRVLVVCIVCANTGFFALCSTGGSAGFCPITPTVGILVDLNGGLLHNYLFTDIAMRTFGLAGGGASCRNGLVGHDCALVCTSVLTLGAYAVRPFVGFHRYSRCAAAAISFGMIGCGLCPLCIAGMILCIRRAILLITHGAGSLRLAGCATAGAIFQNRATAVVAEVVIILCRVCMLIHSNLFGAAVVTSVILVAVGVVAVGLTAAIVTSVILIAIATSAYSSITFVTNMVLVVVNAGSCGCIAAFHITDVVAVTVSILVTQGVHIVVLHITADVAACRSVPPFRTSRSSNGFFTDYRNCRSLMPHSVCIHVCVRTGLYISAVSVLQLSRGNRYIFCFTSDKAHTTSKLNNLFCGCACARNQFNLTLTGRVNIRTTRSSINFTFCRSQCTINANLRIL